MSATTLKIFLAFGDPKRLRTAELSNWTGKAVAGPRSEFEKLIKREESTSSGVYFLSGTDPDTNQSAIYIGEAESIKDRIKSHLSKDFWNNIVYFITKDENLTKAHIRYLEGRLIDIAKIADRLKVMNNQSSGAKLPESDREDMEVFLGKMLQVLPVLGIEAFVQRTPQEESDVERVMRTCKIKKVVASGYLTPLSAVLFQSKEEAEDFYSRHKYIKNASQGKTAILCANENAVGNYLPKGITVYKRYKDGVGFELEPIGSVVHYDRFAFDSTEVTYRVESLMSLVHSTPVESYDGIRLAGPFRTVSGELYMTNIQDPELAFKLYDLEKMGWHLEGDAYHLKETMKVGLDMNYQFSKEFPLKLLNGPHQSELVLGEYVNDDNFYVIIEDVQYLNHDYWLKVKIMSEKSNDYHSLSNGKLEKTGWIKLYSKTSNFNLNSLSLSYYGNGC